MHFFVLFLRLPYYCAHNWVSMCFLLLIVTSHFYSATHSFTSVINVWILTRHWKDRTAHSKYYQVHTHCMILLLFVKQLDSRAPSEFDNRLSIIHAYFLYSVSLRDITEHPFFHITSIFLIALSLWFFFWLVFCHSITVCLFYPIANNSHKYLVALFLPFYQFVLWHPIVWCQYDSETLSSYHTFHLIFCICVYV